MGDLMKCYDKHLTDKGSVFYHAHGYGDFYELFFEKYKKRGNVKILEIGVLDGKSILAHLEYFQNCEIYAIDIDEKCKQYESDNIKIFILDSSNDMALQNFKNEIGDIKFDIILDDGSHQSKDQWRALINLYDILTEDGIYIIEDLHMNKVFNLTQSPCICLPLRLMTEYATNEELSQLYAKIDTVLIWSRNNEKMTAVYPPISVSSVINFKLLK